MIYLDGTLLTKATHGVVIRSRQGWLDGVRHRQNLLDVPQAVEWDELDGKPQTSRRIVRVSGYVIGADHDDLFDKVLALNALAATGSLVALSFEDTGQFLVANAFLSVTYREEAPVGAQRVATFDLVGDCPDSRRYDISGGTPGTPVGGGTPYVNSPLSGNSTLTRDPTEALIAEDIWDSADGSLPVSWTRHEGSADSGEIDSAEHITRWAGSIWSEDEGGVSGDTWIQWNAMYVDAAIAIHVYFGARFDYNGGSENGYAARARTGSGDDDWEIIKWSGGTLSVLVSGPSDQIGSGHHYNLQFYVADGVQELAAQNGNDAETLDVLSSSDTEFDGTSDARMVSKNTGNANVWKNAYIRTNGRDVVVSGLLTGYDVQLFATRDVTVPVFTGTTAIYDADDESGVGDGGNVNSWAESLGTTALDLTALTTDVNKYRAGVTPSGRGAIDIPTATGGFSVASIARSSLFGANTCSVYAVMDDTTQDNEGSLFSWDHTNRVAVSAAYGDTIFWDFGGTVEGTGRRTRHPPPAWYSTTFRSVAFIARDLGYANAGKGLLEIWIDGFLWRSGEITFTGHADPTATWYVGSHGGTPRLDGRLAYLRVCSAEHSHSEIQDNFGYLYSQFGCPGPWCTVTESGGVATINPALHGTSSITSGYVCPWIPHGGLRRAVVRDAGDVPVATYEASAAGGAGQGIYPGQGLTFTP